MLVSDIHLSHTPPIARTAEPDWYKAMARPLKQLRTIAGDTPVLIAGDIFDRWNAPAELINFAIDQLPKNVIAIPGQHDLPNHNYALMRQSAYGTLVKADRITNLDPGKRVFLDTNTKQIFSITGFPWGTPLTQPLNTTRHEFSIALVHHYCWHGEHSYSGAPKSSNAVRLRKALRGFDLCVFGDNHKGFMLDLAAPEILNCGALIRRTADERTYSPVVSVLNSDGSVDRRHLDCKDDKFLAPDEEVPWESVLQAMDTDLFLSRLKRLYNETIDFAEAVRAVIKKEQLPQAVAAVLEAALEKK